MQKRCRFDSDFEESSDEEELVYEKKKRKAAVRPKTFSKLAVIDLDLTLIDNNYVLYNEADTFLSELSNLGYFILLWTAGDENHVKSFLKDYPNCAKYINDYITGLVNRCKPVSVARKKVFTKTHNYLGANIFIDDNVGNIEKSDYDYKFCVLDYLDCARNINYVKLLGNIRKIK